MNNAGAFARGIFYEKLLLVRQGLKHINSKKYGEMIEYRVNLKALKGTRQYMKVFLIQWVKQGLKNQLSSVEIRPEAND